jgi:hypothetical protein
LLETAPQGYARGLEVMLISILSYHRKGLTEFAAKIEKLKNPEGSKGLEGIEKFLQPPSLPDMVPCQTPIETML